MYNPHNYHPTIFLALLIVFDDFEDWWNIDFFP